MNQERNKQLCNLSTLELITIILLERENINYKYCEIVQNKYVIDFLINKNIILEVNGYWHKYSKDYDIQKKTELESAGFVVFMIDVFDKNDTKCFEDNINKLIKQIKNTRK